MDELREPSTSPLSARELEVVALGLRNARFDPHAKHEQRERDVVSTSGARPS